MRFAIPSYQRTDVLIKKTLPTLIKSGITLNEIDIFVSSQEEKIDYETKIINEFFTEKVNVINTDILDLAERLNYMLNKFYPEDTEVVLIEDDIRGVCRGKDNINIKEFTKQAFETLRIENLFLWGISPTDSLMYQKEGYTNDFKFIIGTFYGIIVRHSDDLNVSITYKQDFERTILYNIKDKGVVRFNDIYCKTTYRAVGGLGNDNKNNRLQKEIDACLLMINNYPDYCYQNIKKPREIKLYSSKKIKTLLESKSKNVANLETSKQN